MNLLATFLSLPQIHQGEWLYDTATADVKLTAKTTEDLLPNYHAYAAWLTSLGGTALLTRNFRNANMCHYGADAPGNCLDFNVLGRPVD